MMQREITGLKLIRESHNILAKNLAKFMGISVKKLRDMEYAKRVPSEKELDLLCRLFGVTEEDITKIYKEELPKEATKVYLDEDGYARLIDEIDTLKEKLNQIDLEKHNVLNGKVGRDLRNSLFQDYIIEERKVCRLLNEKYELLQRTEVIDFVSEDNQINVGDIITVAFDEDEEMTFKLVTFLSSTSSDNTEISIESPLGAAVYQKMVGDVSSYCVNGNEFSFSIVNIEKNLNR